MIHRTDHTAATPTPRLRRVAAPCPPTRRGSCLRLPGGRRAPRCAEVGLRRAGGLAGGGSVAAGGGRCCGGLQADPNRRPGELRDDFRAITEGSGVSPEDFARLVSSFWGDLCQIGNDLRIILMRETATSP